MLNFLFGVLFLATISVVCSAEQNLQSTLEQIWNNTDTNGDGMLQRSELDNLIYKTYDGNGDKQVTRTEFMHAYGNTNRMAGENIFNSMDTNNDGHWDHTDIDAIYAAMDANHDHHVTEKETKDWIADLLVKSGFATPHIVG